MKNIIERVKAGEMLLAWETITLTSSRPELAGCALEIQVMQDAMKLQNDAGTWIRFMVSAYQQQQIADIVGGVFHSEKTSEERHKRANTVISPVVQTPPGSGKITALATEDDYNRYVDAAIAKAQPDGVIGIVSAVGKPWSLTNNMAGQQRYGSKTAYNFGWFDKGGIYTSPCGLKCWQSIASGMSEYVHNDSHADPSQVCEFPHNDCTLILADGTQQSLKLADVYRHELYCDFVTHGGPLQIVRQNSVPLS
jgi:hypothetical protein